MDLSVLKYLNGFAGQSEFLNKIIIFSAEYLGFFILAAVIASALLNRKKDGLKIFAASFFSAVFSRFLFTEIIRFFYYRPRPFLLLGLNQIIRHGATFSFPSGHSAFYFGLSFGVFLFRKKIGIILLFASSLVGASRVAAGVHYPTDILGGFILGFISSLFGFFLLRQFYKNFYRTTNPPQ